MIEVCWCTGGKQGDGVFTWELWRLHKKVRVTLFFPISPTPTAIFLGEKLVKKTVNILRNVFPLEELQIVALKIDQQGFPGGAVVGSLPANAGDTGSSPGLGGSHVPRSGWARGPQLLGLRVWSLCSAAGEAAIVGGPRTAMRSGPRLPQLEKALAQKRRPKDRKSTRLNSSH